MDFKLRIFHSGGIYRKSILTDVEIASFMSTSLDRQLLTDCSVSNCYYSDDIVSYKKSGKSGSLVSYNGPCIARSLYLDADIRYKEGDDLSITGSAIKVASDFCKYMRSVGLEDSNFGVYYSGNRGFHFQIPMSYFGVFKPSNITHLILSELAERIITDIGYGKKGPEGVFESDYFDMQMYSPLHMLRVLNTIHPETSRYKIQVSPDKLMSPSAERIILNEASIPSVRKSHIPRIHISSSPPAKFAEWGSDVLDMVDNGKIAARYASKTLAHYSPITDSTLLKVSCGQMSDGETRLKAYGRRKALLLYANFLHSRGINAAMAYNILVMWNNTNIPPLDSKIFMNTFKYVFRDWK